MREERRISKFKFGGNWNNTWTVRGSVFKARIPLCCIKYGTISSVYKRSKALHDLHQFVERRRFTEASIYCHLSVYSGSKKQRESSTRPPLPVFSATWSHTDDVFMTSYSYAWKFTETFGVVSRDARANFCVVIVHVRILGSFLAKLFYSKCHPECGIIFMMAFAC